MSNSSPLVGVILLIVGIIFIIVGAAILNASSSVKTTEGSIENSLMKIPTTLGWGFILGGILLIVIAILIFVKS